MGRYDLRPLQVHQTVKQYLTTPRMTVAPPWYQVVNRFPPAQILTRPQPVQHQERPPSSAKRRKNKKPSRMYQPAEIKYLEDDLRREFFTDHPWELARPRVILEDDGKDAQRNDWSQLEQPQRATDGESVVQRQAWIMKNNPEMSRAEAYDQARREFYQVRYRQDVERRVAKEEALAVGAYFGKSYLDIGMELEDKQWEEYKAFSFQKAALQEQTRQRSYTGGDDEEADDEFGVPNPDENVLAPLEDVPKNPQAAPVNNAPKGFGQQ